MKNKMEIREDPKYLMTNYQGILTLNIRRPSPFDGGTYTCRAFNELGEALAECKLEVRGERRPLACCPRSCPLQSYGSQTHRRPPGASRAGRGHRTSLGSVPGELKDKKEASEESLARDR